jgi:uncharacterized phage protein gp47/JayE
MKTVDEIYEEMMDTFAQETGMEPDRAGEMAVRMYALAVQVYGLYQENAWTRTQSFPQTATGEALENHAALRGLSRTAATCARGTLRFSVKETGSRDLTIPAGTAGLTAGLVTFVTTQAGTLPAGERWVDVPAQAAEPGTSGNVKAGAVRTMSVAPTGIADCTNPTAFTGGAEEESDEALRARVLETYASLPNGTNAAYYEKTALAVAGVAAVKVQPRNRGLGTVDVIIAGTSGLPDQILLDQVQETLEEQREIAVDVQVLAPETVPVNVVAVVKPEDGLLPAPVQERVRQNIADWFDGQQLGKDVLRAKLGQIIYETEGVANYRIDVPSQDVTVGEGKLPIINTLAIEEMT